MTPYLWFLILLSVLLDSAAFSICYYIEKTREREYGRYEERPMRIWLAVHAIFFTVFAIGIAIYTLTLLTNHQ